MNTQAKTLEIDIVSDVVCPWCIVGYRQLAEALEASGTPHEIRWHPFELNPAMPPEGQDMEEHLVEKYGLTKAQSDENVARLSDAGSSVGFEFRFGDTMRMHNTFNVHQLLHWADQQGKKHELKQALFTAHFQAHKNLSDIAVLADIAAGIGLERETALAVLEDQRFAEAVREAEQFWQGQGINSVPAVIFNQRHLVSGAQGVENFTSILKQLAEMKE
ncbi:DsbA family oxidoreductase [Leucothrix mucor]|uniref:DsbA family oxidoreductase n=1 Tax=Leucothrix mucor TaxID=45248 RepID=UPI0003B604DC|nr:DsbA family oxidoreductase [Leucothrix mucor]